MRPSQTAELVTAISQLDDRITPTDATVAMWHKAIGDLDYADAFDAAAAHYGASHMRIMPADVRQGVTDVRRSRLAAVPPVGELMADVDPADPAYNAIWQGRQAAALRRPAPAPGPRALPAAEHDEDPVTGEPWRAR